MKIIQIVPGTGNFYCGSCIRDTALVHALRKHGHEVTLQPLYLPLCTDEPVSENNDSVFFGGVNVYLQQKSNFFRKTPRWIDRLFDSRWLLKFSARQAGMTAAPELGAMTLSMLSGADGNQVKELNRLIDWLKSQDKPDIVILSNGILLGMAKAISSQGIPIVCTLQGEDGFLDALPEPYRSEAWRLLSECARHVKAFIPVSHYHAGLMKERLNLPDDRYTVVQNGISLDGYEEIPDSPPTPVLGYLARLCPVKGLDVLVDAFVELKKNPSLSDLKLILAGTMTNADRPFVETMKKRLEKAGLLSGVSFHPNVSRHQKIEILKSLSVLSVPATYGESFGLYVLEALAAGVPVVQPRHGGFTEIIERTRGGLLYDPIDRESYVSVLTGLLTQPEKAWILGQRGRKVVHDYFNIDRMAHDILQVLQRVL